MGKLDGKIALITGGTSGIGQATALMFSNEGAMVILVGRNDENGQLISKEINKNQTQSKATFFHCDVTNMDDIDNLYSYVRNKYGKLDILFNNAGVLLTRTLDEITLNDWNVVYIVARLSRPKSINF